jgi:hypothetical protein
MPAMAVPASAACLARCCSFLLWSGFWAGYSPPDFVCNHPREQPFMNRPAMSGLMLVGVVLVLLGLLGFAVPYFTTQQTKDVASVGDLKLQATESKSFAIPPLVSGGAVALGVVLIGAGLYRRG